MQAVPLSRTSTRVLLVEDDEGDAFLVRELLLDAGSDVELTRARSVADAASTLPGGIDCVLLDLGLPDASGLNALNAVLELAPNIAVLVLTGLSDEFRGTQAVAAGAQDYLVKGGLDGQLLTRAIRYAVERKRADESVRQLFASEARAAENARLERGLLPQPLLSSADLEVVSLYRPGRHQSLLGGDFYDVVERHDGSVFALIGDVAGHGPDEAALGVCLRIAWRTLVLSGAEPETILAAMDAVLVSERGSDEVFATVAMVLIDPSRRVARFWLAGHPSPALVQAGRVVPVPEDMAGVALGVVDVRHASGRLSQRQAAALDRPPWVGVDRKIDQSTWLMLFTDGLMEGFDGVVPGRRMGEDAVHRLVEELLATGMARQAFGTALLGEVQRRNGGELTDDVAVVLVSWAGQG